MQTIITNPHPAAQRATVDSAARGLLITTLPRNRPLDLEDIELFRFSHSSLSIRR